MDWKVVIRRSRKRAKEEWEEGVERWKREGMVGTSDASGLNKRIGIRGMIWLYGKRFRSWRKGKGYGLTVAEGEMAGAARLLDEVRKYEGDVRVLRVGIDNVGVLKNLRKGRGLCGKREQEMREWGKELIKKGWEIEWRWVLGYEDIKENERVDRLAKEGVHSEMGEENVVLSWGAWEQRRKERVERVWKEYWMGKEKGRAYFGSGKGEKGHKGRRKESIFLFWMRSGHGRMRGTRYRKEDGKCECGEVEDRDHVLLRCEKWEEERKIIWDEWSREGKKGGWVDLKWLLFEEKGIEVVRKFGRATGWIDMR